MGNFFSKIFYTWTPFWRDGIVPWGEGSLRPMGANPDTVTVSGFSGGATMSNDILIIMSDTFKGAGLCSGASFGSNKYWKTSENRDGADIGALSI